MATFESRAHALGIEAHPNADRLELAAIGDFRSGDLAAYIPEGAVCPDWPIEELGLVPVVCEEPFSAAKLAELTDGRTGLKADHIREGVVVRPLEERESGEFGQSF